jgi:meiosis-specific with OB domain-containing protein
MLHKCDVSVFDDSAPSFKIVLWDDEWINLAQSWIPKETIIFAADVRLSYDDWKKMMVATVISKSIVTVNPDTREAHNLHHYAQSVDLNNEEFGLGNGEKEQTMPLNQITAVYRVDQMKDEASRLEKSSNNTVYGIVYAFVSMLNIDDNIASVVARRCSRCHYCIGMDSEGCTNQNSVLLRLVFSNRTLLMFTAYECLWLMRRVPFRNVSSLAMQLKRCLDALL